MLRILILFVFGVIQGAKAQALCLPEPVKDLTLDLNYTLYWTPSTNCYIVSYVVYINIEDDIHSIYESEEPFLDVSFLPSCERFYFEVRAISDSELSDATRLRSIIPAPPEADLSITTLEATTQQNTTFLRWLVTDRYSHCAAGFRVVIYDRYNMPRDVYTANNYLFINNLVPCGQYQFAVMAMYNLAAEGPISLTSYEVPAVISPPPEMAHASEGATYVNISWSLPSFARNRCPIRVLEIEGLPFLHIQYPVDDSPERPLFTTTIEPLQPDNMYVLRAYIVNSAGSSDGFSFGIQTRPTLISN